MATFVLIIVGRILVGLIARLSAVRPAARALVTAAVVVALDQLTKSLVKDRIAPGRPRGRVPRPPAEQRAQHGRGVRRARGGRADRGRADRPVAQPPDRLLRGEPGRAAAVAARGDAGGRRAGNLVDRAREGAVVDFIDPVRWPAFNLADSCIVVGVVLLLWVVERSATSRVELTAGAADAGTRLDAFLAAHGRAARARPRSGWSTPAWCPWTARPGQEPPHGRRRGRGRGRARAERPSPPRTWSSRWSTRTTDLMVVDKPAGLVVHPAPGHAGTTLAEALRGRAAGGADPERAGIVHRLDRDTSGLLVVAKSRGGARRAGGDARAARDPARLRRAGLRASRRRVAARSTRRSAATARAATWSPRARLAGARRSPISASASCCRAPRCSTCGSRPGAPTRSGRTSPRSAIRCAATARYGGRACGTRLGLERQFLHAAKLMFRHPCSGEIVDCESKPPAELQRSLARSTAGASSRRARRELKDGNAGRLLSRPAPIPGPFAARRRHPAILSDRSTQPTTPPGSRPRPCPGYSPGPRPSGGHSETHNKGASLWLPR